MPYINYLLILILSTNFFASNDNNKAIELYDKVNLEMYGLSEEIFNKAILGFEQLKQTGIVKNDNIISIVDYTKPSTEKRFYIIDLNKNEVLLHTYVAHGRESGEDFAQKFSNIESSFQSSLGFYVTKETYYGRHGLSLKLDGIEKDINDKAYKRAIVVHGADYVSEKFIKEHGRLGRSHGCPAVSNEENEKVINLIKGGSAMFVFGKDEHYLQKSSLVN